jgi:hypothetical protein
MVMADSVLIKSNCVLIYKESNWVFVKLHKRRSFNCEIA